MSECVIDILPASTLHSPTEPMPHGGGSVDSPRHHPECRLAALQTPLPAADLGCRREGGYCFYARFSNPAHFTTLHPLLQKLEIPSNSSPLLYNIIIGLYLHHMLE